MPNHVTNRLEIHCEDEKILNKIRMMIFDEDENNNKIYTMQKMLPRPARFSDNQGYNDYGYDWSRAIWGTKWDVYNTKIEETGSTIILNYETAWSPNSRWVECLYMYILTNLNPYISDNTYNTTLKHTYYDYIGDFGGITECVPFNNPVTKNYPFMEYAQLFDKGLFEWACEVEEFFNKANNHENDSHN